MQRKAGSHSVDLGGSPDLPSNRSQSSSGQFNLGSKNDIIKALNHLVLRYRVSSRLSVLLLVGVSLLIIGFCFGFNQFLSVDGGRIYLRHTIEYQLRLVDEEIEWIDRQATLQKWVNTINQNSKLFHLDYKDGKSSVRIEYGQQIDKCGIPEGLLIRMREYVHGAHVGRTTMEVKRSSNWKLRAESYPFWPAQIYVSNSSQKIERDQHECDYKYSRATKLTFPQGLKQLETCGEVLNYFPHAFTLTDRMMNKTLTQATQRYWFVFSHTGKSIHGEAYEMSITLRYDTLEQAIDESAPPIGGEFSFRVDNRDNHKTKKDAETLWKVLSRTYGNEEHC